MRRRRLDYTESDMPDSRGRGLPRTCPEVWREPRGAFCGRSIPACDATSGPASKNQGAPAGVFDGLLAEGPFPEKVWSR
jgi:hypothetical protein